MTSTKPESAAPNATAVPTPGAGVYSAMFSLVTGSPERRSRPEADRTITIALIACWFRTDRLPIP